MILFIIGSVIIIIALILSSVTDLDTSLIMAIWGAALVIHDGLISKRKDE